MNNIIKQDPRAYMLQVIGFRGFKHDFVFSSREKALAFKPLISFELQIDGFTMIASTILSRQGSE